LLAEGVNQPRKGLPLIEEVYKLASTHGLSKLAGQMIPILADVQAMHHYKEKQYIFREYGGLNYQFHLYSLLQVQ